jgi:hypothetical protein
MLLETLLPSAGAYEPQLSIGTFVVALAVKGLAYHCSAGTANASLQGSKISSHSIPVFRNMYFFPSIPSR